MIHMDKDGIKELFEEVLEPWVVDEYDYGTDKEVEEKVKAFRDRLKELLE